MGLGGSVSANPVEGLYVALCAADVVFLWEAPVAQEYVPLRPALHHPSYHHEGVVPPSLTEDNSYLPVAGCVSKCAACCSRLHQSRRLER